MINTDDFMKDTYWFLQEQKYIQKTEASSHKEWKLINKLNKLHNSGSLSDNDYNDLSALCYDAFLYDEINGFLSGIYIAKIINTLV